MIQSGTTRIEPASTERDDLVALFTERGAPLGIEVQRLRDSNSALEALVEIAGNLDTEVAIFSTELLGKSPDFATAVGNSPLTLIPVESPEQVLDAPLGVTTALHAIAETGSLLTSEATLADRTVAMLSLCCVFVVATDDLLPSLDQAGPILRSLALGPEGAYSTLITGPSRTADIEMSLTVGVQGPARIVVLLIDSLT